MSLNTLGSVIELWQTNAEKAVARAEEAQVRLSRARNASRMAAKAARAFASGIGAEEANEAAATARADGKEEDESKAATGADGGRNTELTGPVPTFTVSTANGSASSSQSKPPQADRKAQSRKKKKPKVEARKVSVLENMQLNTTINPTVKAYLKCHASVAAKLHGRMIQVCTR